MDKRAQYLIQILEKIGYPLMDSIISAHDNNANAETDAKRMAELLGKTVQLSINLTEMTDLSSAKDDSIRVLLTALASPLVGGLYSRNKKAPEDADLKRVEAALQAVLSFSDNFAPTNENVESLKNLEGSSSVEASSHFIVQYMHVFLPVLNAVAQFPFGQPEQKLIIDVSARLTSRATQMRESLISGISGDQEKAVDLGILKTLAGLYSACHEAETKRLTENNSQEQEEAAHGIDLVWKNFDIRADMLQALTVGLLNIETPAAAEAETVKEVENVPATTDTTPPETTEKTSQQTVSTTDTPASASNNPMAMFAKPKDGPEDVDAKTDAEKSSPVSPEENASGDGGDSDDDSGSSGSPMSFFKKSE